MKRISSILTAAVLLVTGSMVAASETGSVGAGIKAGTLNIPPAPQIPPMVLIMTLILIYRPLLCWQTFIPLRALFGSQVE